MMLAEFGELQKESIKYLIIKARDVNLREYDDPFCLACVIKELLTSFSEPLSEEVMDRIDELYRAMRILLNTWLTYLPTQPKFTLEEVSRRVLHWQLLKNSIIDVNARLLVINDVFQILQLTSSQNILHDLMYQEISCHNFEEIYKCILESEDIEENHEELFKQCVENFTPTDDFFVVEKLLFVALPKFRENWKAIHDRAICFLRALDSEDIPDQPGRLRLPPSLNKKDILEKFNYLEDSCAKCYAEPENFNNDICLVDSCSHIYCPECLIFINEFIP